MKQPSKFKRWFLRLFGGVPKSDCQLPNPQKGVGLMPTS